MKTGQTLTELAAELERQRESRKDYVAATTALAVQPVPGGFTIGGLNGDAYGVTDHAHGQIASTLDIPAAYYRKMRTEAPALLATNVQTWFEQKPARRMLRTLDRNVRAFLSDRYRPLDNHDLAEVTLPILIERGAQIVSCQITETRMYIKAVLPSLQRDIKNSKRGDVVQAGIVIGNSEVGDGTLHVDPFAYILACLNGATFPDSRLRKYHVGRRAEAEAAVFELLTTEARKADDAAFFLKVRDVVAGAFQPAQFDRLVQTMSESTQDMITKPSVEKVVEEVTELFSLPESSGSSILRHLIDGGDLSRWGLQNAITRASQDVEDYELATKMERVGGEVITLKPTEWRRLAVAA